MTITSPPRSRRRPAGCRYITAYFSQGLLLFIALQLSATTWSFSASDAARRPQPAGRVPVICPAVDQDEQQGRETNNPFFDPAQPVELVVTGTARPVNEPAADDRV